METVAKTIQSQATAPVNKTCSLKKTRQSPRPHASMDFGDCHTLIHSYAIHNLQHSQLLLHFIRSRNGRCSTWS